MDPFKKRNIKEEWHEFMLWFRGVQAGSYRRGLPLTRDHWRLKWQRGSLAGRVGFLIGNGPSVRPADLDRLCQRATFCCNRFYLAYDKMKFRPTHLVSADRQMIEDFGAEMIVKGEAKVWFADEIPSKVKGDYTWVRSIWHRPYEFSRDVGLWADPGGATLITALQIGYHLGIRHFYLYGVDHSFKFKPVEDPAQGHRTAQGDGNHFIANYRSGKLWAPPLTDLIEEAFSTCDRELRREGGWVKNATRGGALEVLERISFEEAVKSADTAEARKI